MCGICGICQTQPISRRALEAAVDGLAHRGPDSSGLFLTRSGRIGLGHTRLAIIDLSSAGHQPMSDENTGVTISFNGEIYNFRDIRDDLSADGYRFQSDSWTYPSCSRVGTDSGLASRCWSQVRRVPHLARLVVAGVAPLSRGLCDLLRDPHLRWRWCKTAQ